MKKYLVSGRWNYLGYGDITGTLIFDTYVSGMLEVGTSGSLAVQGYSEDKNLFLMIYPEPLNTKDGFCVFLLEKTSDSGDKWKGDFAHIQLDDGRFSLSLDDQIRALREVVRKIKSSYRRLDPEIIELSFLMS